MSIAGEIEPVLAGPEEIRRRSILGEALKIFARFGFQKASMGQVARAAGLSRQGLYRHFSSKESLFRDSILFALQTSLAEAAAVLASRDLPLTQRILAALQAWVGKHIDEVGENYPELVEAVGLHVEPDRISDFEARLLRHLVSSLRRGGMGAVCKERGVTLSQMADTLLATAIGLRSSCRSSGEFRRRMAIHLKVVLGSPRTKDS